MLLRLAVLLLLAGCSQTPAPRPSHAQRVEAAEAAIAKTPAARTYYYGDSQLKVFSVPTRDERGYLDWQQCYVWRDAEFKTASIACPIEGDAMTSSGPEREAPSY